LGLSVPPGRESLDRLRRLDDGEKPTALLNKVKTAVSGG
jgi:hypothetical protein